MKFLLPAGLLAIWLGMIPLQQSIDHKRSEFPVIKENEFVTVQDVFLQAISDFRVSLANILWLRVDQYLHLFVLREQLEEKYEGKSKRLEEETLHEHEAHHVDDHGHSKEMEAEFMPIIRLVTWLDPHFILAYQVGAWTLYERLNKTAQAETFLMEGLKFNPDSYEIYSELGYLYFFKLKDYKKAVQAYNNAIKFPGASENDLKRLIRMLAYSYEFSGNTQKAIQVIKEYMKADPQNGRVIKHLNELEEKLKKETIPGNAT